MDKIISADGLLERAVRNRGTRAFAGMGIDRTELLVSRLQLRVEIRYGALHQASECRRIARQLLVRDPLPCFGIVVHIDRAGALERVTPLPDRQQIEMGIRAAAAGLHAILVEHHVLDAVDNHLHRLGKRQDVVVGLHHRQALDLVEIELSLDLGRLGMLRLVSLDREMKPAEEIKIGGLHHGEQGLREGNVGLCGAFPERGIDRSCANVHAHLRSGVGTGCARTPDARARNATVTV